MDIIFTRHAEYRLKKRGLLKHEIIDAIKYPNKIIKKRGKYLFRKRLEKGTIEVCCEKTERNIKIITVYWI